MSSTTILTKEQRDTIIVFYDNHMYMSLNHRESNLLKKIIMILNDNRHIEIEQEVSDVLNDIRTKYIKQVLKK